MCLCMSVCVCVCVSLSVCVCCMAKCETQSSSALLEISPCLQRKRRICLARSQVRRCAPTSLLYKLSVQHSVQQSVPQLNCYRTCHLRKDANQSNLRKITLLYDIMPALPIASEVVSHTRCRDVVSPCSDTTVGSPEVGGSYFTLDGVADRSSIAPWTALLVSQSFIRNRPMCCRQLQAWKALPESSRM